MKFVLFMLGLITLPFMLMEYTIGLNVHWWAASLMVVLGAIVGLSPYIGGFLLITLVFEPLSKRKCSHNS